MAGTTDRLVGQVREVAPLHDAREYDTVVAAGEQVTAGLLALALEPTTAPAAQAAGAASFRASSRADSQASIDRLTGSPQW